MVEILHYEEASKGKVIGYADVKISIMKPASIILRKLAHIQSNDKTWFNLPAFPRGKLDQNQEYYKYFEFENSTFNFELLNAVKGEIKEFLEHDR